MNKHTATFFVLALSAGCESEPEEVDRPFGAPCEIHEDCASGLCLSVGTPFCTQECAHDCNCPPEMMCAAVNDELSVCAPGASSCEMPEEDAGTPELDAGTVMPPLGGPGALCNSSADCGEVWSRGGTGPSAEGMWVPQECFTTIPGGYCSMIECEENFRRDPCPLGTGCFSNRRGGICLDICEDGPSECRDGWACRTDLDSNPLCSPPCSDTGCPAGLVCTPSGSCVEPSEIPVEYDVTTRSVALDAPLSPVDGMAELGANLVVRLPFQIRFFGLLYASGALAVASWQGLFAFDRVMITAYTPGNHVRYEPTAPVIVAHNYENSSGGGSVSYRVSGTAPSRTLEVEWVTTNLSGTGGARFRLRFNEGVDAFVVHYGPITDDAFAGTWTQLAMRDATQFEEVIVSTGAPTPASRANTEFTYTPR